MEPESWLVPKCKVFKVERFPILTGICPLRLLFPKFKDSSFGKWHKDDGIKPVKLFPNRYKF